MVFDLGSVFRTAVRLWISTQRLYSFSISWLVVFSIIRTTCINIVKSDSPAIKPVIYAKLLWHILQAAVSNYPLYFEFKAFFHSVKTVKVFGLSFIKRGIVLHNNLFIIILKYFTEYFLV